MLLVFTDGLDDDVEDLEETVENVKKKGKMLHTRKRELLD